MAGAAAAAGGTGTSGPMTYPDVPALVVSGDLDNMTSVADGAAAAAHFPRAHHVVLTNGLHVNALAHSRSECGAKLVRRFIENLSTGDDSCAAEVPPVRLVPRFARSAAELAPAHGGTDNAAGEAALRVVSAALFTAADVITRTIADGAGSGVGLRAGSFTAAPPPRVSTSPSMRCAGPTTWPSQG